MNLQLGCFHRSGNRNWFDFCLLRGLQLNFMKQTLLFIFLVLSSSVGAQVVTVRDAVNRQPLEFVTVISWQPKTYAITDGKGRVDLTQFAGSDSIVFQEVGHKEIQLTYDQSIELESILMERGEFDLGGVTISAARWKQPKRDVPNKITAIDPDQVYFENPQTAADLLESSGEVYVQKSQMGGGSPMIRGFATNRVMLSVDGVRMNNAIFRSGNLQNVISLDPLAIENAEVVFGPGSVIYGSDAIGGVMSFYTTEPDLSQSDEPLVKGNAFVRGSTANRERTGHLDFNIGYRKFAMVTSVSYSDFENLMMGSNGPDEYLRYHYIISENGIDVMVENPNPREQISTAYDQVNLMQKFRYKPNRFWEITYGGHYSTTSDFGRYDRQIRYRGDTLRSSEWYYGPQEWMMHTVNVVNVKPNKIYDKMSLTTAYQMFKESRNDRDYQYRYRTNAVERVYAPSVNLDFEQDLGERHELFYGLEGVYNLVHSRASIKDVKSEINTLAQTRYPHESIWVSTSAYVSDQFRINDIFTLQSGMRYSLVMINAQLDTSFLPLPETEVDLMMDALNGSLGLAYKPNDKVQLNLNLSTGFRAPNIDDIGKTFDSEPGAVVIPNPDLLPEYAYNGELGLVKIFKDFLKLDATIYYAWLNNALVRRNDQLGGQDSVQYGGDLSQVQSIQNAANAQVYGAQAGFEWKIWRGITMGSRINYQKGQEELDDGSVAPLRHAPPVFGSARIGYQRERLQAQVSTEFNGKVSNRNLAPSEQGKDYIYSLNSGGDPYSPSWMVLNSRASYQIKDNFMVSAGVENILDKRYRPYSSGISAPGRNFIGSVRYSF